MFNRSDITLYNKNFLKMIVINRFLVSTEFPFESSLKKTELKEAEIATARKIIFIS